MKRGYYLLLGLLALVLASAPYLYGFFHTPKGQIYTGLTINIDDCMVYLSWIEEYASGRFTQRDLFSTEAQNPVLFYLWFWILGMLSKLIGTLGAFHAGRVLGGAGLLLAVRWLLNLTLADEKARKLGYALTCFASGLGWIFGGFDPAKGFNGQPIDNFTPEAITFLSLGFSPLFAPMTALMVIFACGLLRAERTKKRVDLWPSAVAGAILGNSHTYDVVPLFLMALFWRLFSERRWDRAGWMRLILVGLAALPTTAINVWASRTDPLFRARVWTNEPTLTPLPWWVVLGWGIPFALALTAIFRKNKTEFVDSAGFRLLACWLLAHCIAIYLPLPVQRKFLMGAHIPLCALAGAALAGLLARIPGDLPKALGPLIVGVCAAGSALSLLTDIGRLDANVGTTAARPYLTLSEKAALDWLRKDATDGACLVSPDPSSIRRYPFQFAPHLAPQIAGLAHRTVYNGHWSETLNYGRKFSESLRFYQSDTPDEWRQILLKDNHISYILYVNKLSEGPPTTTVGESLPYSSVDWHENFPPWLVRTYQNPEITIFQVR